jgi:chromosome segregation ATPase
MTAIAGTPKLLKQEVEYLRAEVERLRALSQNNAHSWDTIVRERNELRAEVERLEQVVAYGVDMRIGEVVTERDELRAEVERLRTALSETFEALNAQEWSRAAAIISHTLEPKP